MELSTLTRQEWRPAQEAHAARVDALTAGIRDRAARGEKHPIEDFLVEYYGHSPGRLRRWEPGPGRVLLDAADAGCAGRSHHRTDADGTVRLDTEAFVARRGRTVRFVRDLLAATLSRPAATGCFGLHEWAMVYRLAPGQQRHEALPLRLTQAETDAVVEGHRIRCSHFDAYRFFTADARPRNRLRPTRETQIHHEQPGCLHAGMDVYKWCFKLAPAVPSELTADAFEHALAVRVLDMQASPYDLAAFDLPPVRIETSSGKAEFVDRQRDLVARSNALRHRLLEVCDALLLSAPAHPPA